MDENWVKAQNAHMFAGQTTAVMIFGKASRSAGGGPPEDAKLDSSKGEQNFATRPDIDADSRERASRWSRIIANDLENIPIGLFVFISTYIAVLMMPQPNTQAEIKRYGACAEAYIALFVFYAIFRTLHTITYANSMQPGRTLMFLFGQLCVLSTAIVGMVCAFLHKPIKYEG